MEDNARNSVDSLSDSFEVINISDVPKDEGNSGSSRNSKCEKCHTKYKEKEDIITRFKIECQKGYCLRCGKEMLSSLWEEMMVTASSLQLRVYKVEQLVSVSSNVEKSELAAKLNSPICKFCTSPCVKGNDIKTWYKIVCEKGEYCLDCGKAKCSRLLESIEKTSLVLDVEITEEKFQVPSASSNVEKLHPAEGPSEQIVCPCCSFVVVCWHCRMGFDVICQGSCSCCTRNANKNMETVAEGRAQDPELPADMEVIANYFA